MKSAGWDCAWCEHMCMPVTTAPFPSIIAHVKMMFSVNKHSTNVHLRTLTLYATCAGAWHGRYRNHTARGDFIHSLFLGSSENSALPCALNSLLLARCEPHTPLRTLGPSSQIPESPASYRSHLQSGLELVAIDGVVVEGQPLAMCYQALWGRKVGVSVC